MGKTLQRPNRLRELIEESGYSFREVAEKTKIAERTLYDWAKGNRVIPPSGRELITEVIGCKISDLKPQTPSLQLIDEMSIHALEIDMAERWEIYYTIGAMYVVGELREWMEELGHLVLASEGTIWCERLQVLLTIGYQLQSCVWRDLMNYRQSHIAYHKAFNIAQEMDDTELMVSSLARAGVTLIQQDKPREAIIYLTGALNILDNNKFPALRGHIFQGLSEAYAKAGQTYDSTACIEQAELYLTQQLLIERRSQIRGATTVSIAAQRGVNAVLLRDYQQAIVLIDDSLKGYNLSLVRGRARLIAQKAEAYLGLKNIDACTCYASEALSLAKSAGSTKTITRIQNLYDSLNGCGWRKEKSVIQLGYILREST